MAGSGLSSIPRSGRRHYRHCRGCVRLFGSRQAKRYHDELFAIFDLIADNPRMARERFELSPPMRIHPFKAHLVVYRVEEDGGVLIVRVRHGHEDWAGDASQI